MKEYHCIGLMSGTSLDGLDLCYVRFSYPEFGFEILKTETVLYSEEWIQKLKNAIYFSGEKLTQLDIDYGYILGEFVNRFIEKYEIEIIDFIASHGHTVFHNPEEGYTLQIGNGTAISTITNIKTIYDFRTQDVILGGQGAPLVPIGDELLFSEYDACLNLGGFSNISFSRNQKRMAFDICPVNIVLNKLSESLGIPFDSEGKIAKSSKVNVELIHKLDQLDYYHKIPPKSLGIEWCNENIFPLFHNSNSTTEELIATFTEHSAEQIALVLNQNSIKNVLITGGGAYNSYLIELIRSKSKTKLIIPSKDLIKFKEALIFAFMGMLRIENQVNVYSSVTGARKDHCSGIIIPKEFEKD